MKPRKIIKAKLTKLYTGEITYKEINGDDIEDTLVNIICPQEASPDLVAAMEDLRIHLATLCEQGSYTDYEDNPEKLNIYRVTGVSVGGDDDHEGVTLSGSRQLQGNLSLNLNAPFCKLNPDHSHYSYAGSLEMALNTVLSEFDEYLNGKYAPSPQLNLFDSPAEEGAEEEVKPKRRSRKLPKDHPIVKGLGDDVEVTVEI